MHERLLGPIIVALRDETLLWCTAIADPVEGTRWLIEETNGNRSVGPCFVPRSSPGEIQRTVEEWWESHSSQGHATLRIVR